MRTSRVTPATFVRGLPHSLAESISAISSQACCWVSIGSGLAWIGPLSYYPDFMHSTVYLEAINAKAPRVPFLCILIALAVYQFCALHMPRPPKAIDDGSGDRVNAENRTRSIQTLKWLRYRRGGHIAGIVGWGFMTYAAATIRFTPGTGWFAMTALFCFVGAWRLYQETLEEQHTLNGLDAMAESARCLREHNICMGEIAAAATST